MVDEDEDEGAAPEEVQPVVTRRSVIVCAPVGFVGMNVVVSCNWADWMVDIAGTLPATSNCSSARRTPTCVVDGSGPAALPATIWSAPPLELLTFSE